MAMPKNITLINKQTKGNVKLDFQHALRVLILDKSQGRDTYKLKGDFIFDGTDIVRKPKKETEE